MLQLVEKPVQPELKRTEPQADHRPHAMGFLTSSHPGRGVQDLGFL
jgi:hypothetical protein